MKIVEAAITPPPLRLPRSSASLRPQTPIP